MAPAKKDKTMAALETVHAALKSLDPEDRQRVLTSVRALLEIPSPAAGNKEHEGSTGAEAGNAARSVVLAPHSGARPLSIRELIQDKNWRSQPQLITLFAYFREKHENSPAFSRGDLEKYYKSSRENKPANYDRDFVEAVKKGWIHEDGDNSYITSKGIEAVESSFAGAVEKKGRSKGRKN